MNAVEIPVFPAGVLKIYNNPKPPVIPSMEEFEFNQQVISNPDTTQFLEASNIIDHDGLADLKVWLEECVKDYLDNVMTLDYRDFWIHESWLNKAEPGSSQSMHNHGNSLISGVYYVSSLKEHPPLVFEKMPSNSDPFFSLRKHYGKANANFTNKLAMPCTQGSLIMFNSYLFHGFGQNVTDQSRVSLAFNVLANLTEKDAYRIDFVKNERWLNTEDATNYSVDTDGSDGLIQRRMSK
jgi:uncharacterized protein (TIGR02466 family)|tara:strand:+ start:204 stop:917 length:714 start_codon:yes stop_codon:yes gene_type:complete